MNPLATSENIQSHISPWLIRWVYPLGCYWLLPTYFGNITIKGQDYIPKTDPVIVAPIHRSRWDALLVPHAVGRLVTGRDLRFMVMSSEMKGIQGWFIRHLGGFPVDIHHPHASSLGHSVELLKQGEMLVMFPEGGIFRDHRVHPLKRGVARIALEVEAQQPKSGIKILPISIDYDQAIPRWGTNVTINISQPLDVASYQEAGMKKNSEKLTQDLENRLKYLYESSFDCREIVPNGS
jgi:1-acyl-sn-glycerol-3-phosphate acyltransferase